MTVEPKFQVGDIVHHQRFDYRGVIYDVDPDFRGTDAWYSQVATSKPPKIGRGTTSWSTVPCKRRTWRNVTCSCTPMIHR